MAKRALEQNCEVCCAEYMITYDGENIVDEPAFCPFCASPAEQELDFGEDRG